MKLFNCLFFFLNYFFLFYSDSSIDSTEICAKYTIHVNTSSIFHIDGHQTKFNSTSLDICNYLHVYFLRKLQLDNFDFDSNLIQNLNRYEKLVNLAITKSKMSKFLIDLSKLFKIKYVSLTYNDLFKLTYPEMLNEHIEYLDLSHNSIDYIQFDFFKKLYAVREILLNNNKIKVLYSLVINSLKLELLDLSRNDIETCENILINNSFILSKINISIQYNNLNHLPAFFAKSNELNIEMVDIRIIKNKDFKLINYDYSKNNIHRIQIKNLYADLEPFNNQQNLAFLCSQSMSDIFVEKIILENLYEFENQTHRVKYTWIETDMKKKEILDCKQFNRNSNNRESTLTFEINKNYTTKQNIIDKILIEKSFKLDLAKFFIERPALVIQIYLITIFIFCVVFLMVEIFFFMPS